MHVWVAQVAFSSLLQHSTEACTVEVFYQGSKLAVANFSGIMFGNCLKFVLRCVSSRRRHTLTLLLLHHIGLLSLYYILGDFESLSLGHQSLK